MDKTPSDTNKKNQSIKPTAPDTPGNQNPTNDPNQTNKDASTTSSNAGLDPEVAALRQKPLDEQLWFFIDDVIPTDTHDTELVLCETGLIKNGIPEFQLIPKSIEIFEEIGNIPNHVAPSYPHMVKYFPDILNLYNNYVKQDINPYWECVPLGIPAPAMVHLFLALKSGHQAFISQKPKQGSLPFRLIYGDLSHKHDFVGVVYLYIQ